MAATLDSGQGHGSGGHQIDIEETEYPIKQTQIESVNKPEPQYVPSPKHEPGGWGSSNPIKNQAEGQRLLDTGYKNGRQIYNVTDEGKIVKFQPDNSPQNGFHAYEVTKPRDIPPSILRQMRDDGKISSSEYNRILKGK